MNRVDFFKQLGSFYRAEEIRRVQKAYWLSKNVHRPQKRDDGERYFEHPRRVARLLIDIGHRNVDTVITALLHDVVEDTWTPDHVIVDLFGPQVWENISLLSKTRPVLDPVNMEMISVARIDKEIYFNQIARANLAVRLVKVADRIDNTTDLPAFKEERKQKYIKETKEFILPIAEKTDVELLRQLKLNLSLAINHG